MAGRRKSVGPVNYYELPRKQLQSLCKKYGFPANKTNVAMAEFLTSYLNSEEYLNRDMSLPSPAVKTKFQGHDTKTTSNSQLSTTEEVLPTVEETQATADSGGGHQHHQQQTRRRRNCFASSSSSSVLDEGENGHEEFLDCGRAGEAQMGVEAGATAAEEETSGRTSSSPEVVAAGLDSKSREEHSTKIPQALPLQEEQEGSVPVTPSKGEAMDFTTTTTTTANCNTQEDSCLELGQETTTPLPLSVMPHMCPETTPRQHRAPSTGSIIRHQEETWKPAAPSVPADKSEDGALSEINPSANMEAQVEDGERKHVLEMKLGNTPSISNGDTAAAVATRPLKSALFTPKKTPLKVSFVFPPSPRDAKRLLLDADPQGTGIVEEWSAQKVDDEPCLRGLDENLISLQQPLQSSTGAELKVEATELLQENVGGAVKIYEGGRNSITRQNSYKVSPFVKNCRVAADCERVFKLGQSRREGILALKRAVRRGPVFPEVADEEMASGGNDTVGETDRSEGLNSELRVEAILDNNMPSAGTNTIASQEAETASVGDAGPRDITSPESSPAETVIVGHETSSVPDRLLQDSTEDVGISENSESVGVPSDPLEVGRMSPGETAVFRADTSWGKNSEMKVLANPGFMARVDDDAEAIALATDERVEGAVPREPEPTFCDKKLQETTVGPLQDAAFPRVDENSEAVVLATDERVEGVGVGVQDEGALREAELRSSLFKALQVDPSFVTRVDAGTPKAAALVTDERVVEGPAAAGQDEAAGLYDVQLDEASVEALQDTLFFTRVGGENPQLVILQPEDDSAPGAKIPHSVEEEPLSSVDPNSFLVSFSTTSMPTDVDMEDAVSFSPVVEELTHHSAAAGRVLDDEIVPMCATTVCASSVAAEVNQVSFGKQQEEQSEEGPDANLPATVEESATNFSWMTKPIIQLPTKSRPTKHKFVKEKAGRPFSANGRKLELMERASAAAGKASKLRNMKKSFNKPKEGGELPIAHTSISTYDAQNETRTAVSEEYAGEDRIVDHEEENEGEHNAGETTIPAADVGVGGEENHLEESSIEKFSQVGSDLRVANAQDKVGVFLSRVDLEPREGWDDSVVFKEARATSVEQQQQQPVGMTTPPTLPPPPSATLSFLDIDFTKMGTRQAAALADPAAVPEKPAALSRIDSNRWVVADSMIDSPLKLVTPTKNKDTSRDVSEEKENFAASGGGGGGGGRENERTWRQDQHKTPLTGKSKQKALRTAEKNACSLREQLLKQRRGIVDENTENSDALLASIVQSSPIRQLAMKRSL